MSASDPMVRATAEAVLEAAYAYGEATESGPGLGDTPLEKGSRLRIAAKAYWRAVRGTPVRSTEATEGNDHEK